MTQMNLSAKQKHTDVESRLVVAKREGGEVLEFGLSRYKLLYIGWVNNKVLLYSIGNYIQYAVIKHNGKFIYIYIHTHTCTYIYMYT